MKTIIEAVMGRKRVLVQENERVIHLYKGAIQGILMPGEHLLDNRHDRLALEWCELETGFFYSEYEQALFAKHGALADQHLQVFATGPDQTGVLERDGMIVQLMGPDSRLTVWKDAGPWTMNTHDLKAGLAVEKSLLKRISAANIKNKAVLTEFLVTDGYVGLLSVDGVVTETVKPGAHGYWKAGRDVAMRMIDLRRKVLEVSGQELLTKDRVTIRVNIAADYRITDPETAATVVDNFEMALYRELQYAFRRALGAISLDAILEDKIAISDEAKETIRGKMAGIGLEVFDVTLKDIILPGEMRDILNTVFAAQKEAEANIIRRREETNATRSLLNTAKVMAENPVMLRLKELEALEAVAGKVERLTVHNGTSGLMNDLVSLRDKD